MDSKKQEKFLKERERLANELMRIEMAEKAEKEKEEAEISRLNALEIEQQRLEAELEEQKRMQSSRNFANVPYQSFSPHQSFSNGDNLNKLNPNSGPGIKDPDFTNKKKWFHIFKSIKKSKKGKVAIIFLGNDGSISTIFKEPKDGMFSVAGRKYHETDCYFTYGPKRIPVVVIAEWGLVPISRENYAKFFASDAQEAQQLIIKAVENAEIVRLEGGEKKKLNPTIIIGVIVLAVVGFYLYSKYGKGTGAVILPLVRGAVGI